MAMSRSHPPHTPWAVQWGDPRLQHIAPHSRWPWSQKRHSVASLSLLGQLGGLPSDDHGASPGGGSPVDHSTAGTPLHSQLESSKRFSPAVGGSQGLRATLVEGIGGRCKARVPPPRCFRERR